MELTEIECDIMGLIELAQHVPLSGFHTKGDELLGSIKTGTLFLFLHTYQ
jgi:hypothetical protein